MAARKAARKGKSFKGNAAGRGSGLTAVFAAAFKKVDQDSLNEAFGSTPASTGERWMPPKGDYYCQVEPTESFQDLVSVYEEEGKDPVMYFRLPLKIVQANDDDLKDRVFQRSFRLAPYERDDGTPVIIDAGYIKAACQEAFEEVPDDLQEACTKLYEDSIKQELTWDVRVQPSSKNDKYTDVYLNGVVELET